MMAKKTAMRQQKNVQKMNSAKLLMANGETLFKTNISGIASKSEKTVVIGKLNRREGRLKND